MLSSLSFPSLSPSFLIIPSLSLALFSSLLFCFFFSSPSFSRTFALSLSRYTCLRIYIGHRFLCPRACTRPTREGSIVVTVGNSREAVLPFPPIPFLLISFSLSSSVFLFPFLLLYSFSRVCVHVRVQACTSDKPGDISPPDISITLHLPSTAHLSRFLAPST